ncbi:MAG: hypothetical protein EPO63_01980 [Candidatus Nitrosotenuis sp.]|nr:MAG: hypothetical protein EPO63_01980 [Candidatus Nitrosotenuis sp.]
MIVHDINFVSGILILASSAVPLYLSFKLKKELRVLTMLLAVFLLSHATYHILSVSGFEFLGESVFEPVSVVALIIFGFAYLKTREKREVIT